MSTQDLRSASAPVGWDGWRLRCAEELFWSPETVYGIYLLFIGKALQSLKQRVTLIDRVLASDAARRVQTRVPARDPFSDATALTERIIHRNEPPRWSEVSRLRTLTARGAKASMGAVMPGSRLRAGGVEAEGAHVEDVKRLLQNRDAFARLYAMRPVPQPTPSANQLYQQNMVQGVVRRLQTPMQVDTAYASLRARAEIVGALEAQTRLGDPTIRLAFGDAPNLPADLTVRVQRSPYNSAGAVPMLDVALDRPWSIFGVRATDLVCGGTHVYGVVVLPDAQTLRIPAESGGRASIRPAAWAEWVRAEESLEDRVPVLQEELPISGRADVLEDALFAELAVIGGALPPETETRRLQRVSAGRAPVAPPIGILDTLLPLHAQLRVAWSTHVQRALVVHRGLLSAGFDRAAERWLSGHFLDLIGIADAAAATQMGAVDRGLSAVIRAVRR